MAVNRNPFAGGTFMTPADLGKMLKISVRTLEKWRNQRTGPKWYAFGYRQIRYFDQDVISWVAAHEVNPRPKKKSR